MAIALGSWQNTTGVFSTSVSQTGPTISGSNTIGFAVLHWQTNENISAANVTWGGSAMTLVGQFAQESSLRRGALLFIYNPSSGATVQATKSASSYFAIATGYYTGVAQSGQPDSSATPSAASGTTWAESTTVVATGCWLIGIARNPNNITSVGSGTTERSDIGPTTGVWLADSNGTVGTGAQSLNWNGNNGAWNGAIGSFFPATATVNSNFFAFM